MMRNMKKRLILNKIQSYGFKKLRLALPLRRTGLRVVMVCLNSIVLNNLKILWISKRIRLLRSKCEDSIFILARNLIRA